MSSIYTYDQLKKAAKEARADLFAKGYLIKKKGRRKPRTQSEKDLLFNRALNRLERYPPIKDENKIILPYFSK